MNLVLKTLKILKLIITWKITIAYNKMLEFSFSKFLIID
jgi:hypothetical protein